MSREQLNQQSDVEEQDAHQSAENSSASPSASNGRLGAAPPNPTDPRHLLQIQRTLGNQATVRYLQRMGKIQRQDGDADTSDYVPIPELDPEIEATLDSLFSADRQAAPTEIITSSTGAELTYEGLSPPIGDMWQRHHIRFDDAARAIAEGNTIEGEDTIPTQTAELADPQGRAYSRRWAVVIANSDYPGTEGDLPEVHAALQTGSPYESALSGSFAERRIFENVTAADTVSNIRLVINELMIAMQGNEAAELVIYLSGHGSNGDFIGVDRQPVFHYHLRELGEMARQYNIHPVIIFDACTAGSAVSGAQEASINFVQGRIDQLPPDQQAVARQQLSLISDFAITIDAMSLTAATIRNIISSDPLSPDIDPLGFDPPQTDEGNYFNNLQYQFNLLRDLLASGRLDILAEPSVEQFRTHFDQAYAWVNDVSTALEVHSRDDGFPLRPIARILDDANTIMNNVLRRIDQQIHAAPPQGGQP